MDFALFVMVATLLASTDGLNQLKVPLTIIPGKDATCATGELLEMAQHNLSAKVDELISGTK